ncbi:MAG: transposase family protein [Nitrospirae bacterium]|nr:transposase family protein [Nitrospirota bacterium]
MKLKALMPLASCRTIADTFNRMFFCTKNISVGKTFVNTLIRKHRYQIEILRKKIKNAKPKPVPKNLIWGMDLTGKTDTHGKLHMLLGIIEHGSRANLCLKALKNKSSLQLLKNLIGSIQKNGKPKILKTDNEPVFTSFLFKFTLFLLGIRHRPITPGCPWQNGRIERFFLSLKEKLNQIEVDSFETLNDALVQFRFWYNHVRTHRHLNGKTPAEVWSGKETSSNKRQNKNTGLRRGRVY